MRTFEINLGKGITEVVELGDKDPLIYTFETIIEGQEGLKAEITDLKNELAKAVSYLREGKARFSPDTTNSFVDDFIAKHWKPEN